MTLATTLSSTLSANSINTAYTGDFYESSPTSSPIDLSSLDSTDYVFDPLCGFLYELTIEPRLEGTSPSHSPLPPGMSWNSASAALTYSKCPGGQDVGGVLDDPDCSIAPADKSVNIVMVARLKTPPS